MSLLKVQTYLKSKGFDPGPLDGEWGKLTEAAVMAAITETNGPPLDDDPETVKLIGELRRDEGCVLSAYRDSLGYLTIGVGRLVDKMRGGGISDEEADMLLANDIAKVRRQLDENLPWWRDLDAVRQRAIQNMAFQLGIAGLVGFKNSLALIRSGDWASAATNLQASKWAQQTPARAGRVIEMIRTGRV